MGATRGTQTGSIEPGKAADLIVLDRNLFATDPNAIAATRVAMTLFEGRVV
jgi:predicted amidohydrolase YtcJ